MSKQAHTKYYKRYPGSRAFRTEEQALFFGRAVESRQLSSLIKTEALALLFSKSGLGKSSLLNASALPKLEKEGFFPISVRFQVKNTSPIAALKASVQQRMEEAGLQEMVVGHLQGLSLNDSSHPWLYLQACAEILTYISAKPLLVFDQFEELFYSTPHPDEKEQYEQRIAFAQLLGDLLYQRTPLALHSSKVPQEVEGQEVRQALPQPLVWKSVFAIRADKLSLVDELSAELPAILQKRYQLLPLTREKARAALIEPARSTVLPFLSPPFEYTVAAEKEILDALSNDRGEIESFQLQIICQHLEQQVIEKNLQEVNSKEVGGRKGVERVLRDYYETQIRSIGTSEEQYNARVLIEEKLIVGGTRVGLQRESILNAAGYSVSAALLAKLENSRLIKADNTHLGRTYEVAHDTLLAPILKAKEIRLAQERQQALTAEKRALEAQKAAELAEERKKRRRLWAGIFIVGGLALLATGFGIWAWFAEEAAARNAERAVQKEQEALAARDTAKYQRRLAIQARDTIQKQYGLIAQKSDSLVKATDRAQTNERRALTLQQQAEIRAKASTLSAALSYMESSRPLVTLGGFNYMLAQYGEQLPSNLREAAIATQQRILKAGAIAPHEWESYSPTATADNLVATANNGRLSLWNIEGQRLRQWSVGNGPIYQIDFSSDGNRVTIRSWDGYRKTWSVQGQLLRSETISSDWNYRRAKSASQLLHYLRACRASGQEQVAQAVYQHLLRQYGEAYRIYAPRDLPAVDLKALPGGSFQMGCADEDARNNPYCQEAPLHEVQLPSFQMAKTPVTQELWEVVMGNNPSRFNKGIETTDFPVEQISWLEAQSFCFRLNVLTGRNYRLPTEAEWAFAAHRASEQLRAQAWLGQRRTYPVAEKASNAFGLNDIFGNVRSWCADPFSPDAYTATETNNPISNVEPSKHRHFYVNRGCAYNTSPQQCLPYRRYRDLWNEKSSEIGLRLVE